MVRRESRDLTTRVPAREMAESHTGPRKVKSGHTRANTCQAKRGSCEHAPSNYNRKDHFRKMP